MINLHMVQLATATLRTTHVTTCVELLPRRYSRWSGEKMDGVTSFLQIKSLGLFFGRCGWSVRTAAPDLLGNAQAWSSRTKNNRQSAEHLRLHFLQDHKDQRFPAPQTPRAAIFLLPRDLSTTGHERRASASSPHSSSAQARLHQGCLSWQTDVQEVPVPQGEFASRS